MAICRHLWLAMAAAVVLIESAAATTRDEIAVLVGGRTVHVVERGDTLSSLGARFGIEPRVAARMNSLRADARLQLGQRLVLDNRHIVPESTGEDLVINIPQRLLFVFTDDPPVSAYPVAVGSPGWPTFTGPFVVASLETDPVWDVPRSIQEEQRRAGKPVLSRVAPGPGNPLGAYWIGLSRPGFGIHSTNAPLSIYRFVTHGCIRLHPEDAEKVFSTARVGMLGRITYEPVLLTRTPDGTILLEANPDIYRRQPNPLAKVHAVAAALEVGDLMDWNAVAAVLKDRDGVPVDVLNRAATSSAR